MTPHDKEGNATLLRADNLAQLALLIAESSSDVIYAKDANGRLLFANTATLELVGKTADAVIGHTDNEFLADPHAAAQVMANDRRIMAAGVPEEVEEMVPMPDGTMRYWASRKVPFRDASGEVIGLFGISHDITERKRLEAELRESRDRLRQILESITDGLVVLDEQWRYTYLNAAGAQMLGVEPQDLMGQSLWEAYPAADDLRFGRAYREAMRTQKATRVEDFYPAPLNKWVECHCYPSPTSLSVFFRDVTGRHRDREALERSEERLRRLFELNPTGVVTGDADGRIHDANDAFLKMVGYTTADLYAGQIRWSAITPPEHSAKDENAIREVATHGVSRVFEKEYWRRDGSRVPVMIACARFDRGDEEMVAFVIDISERKRAEQKLQQADREKDRFLATLAHELRNPLAPIRSAAALLASPSAKPDRINWASQLISRQVSHMAILLDDLLDISRITAGKLTLRPETVVFADVIERAVEAARPLMEERGHALTVTQSGGLRVQADPVRLGQVLTNLLTNAAKYTPPGGAVQLEARAEGTSLFVSVRDNGIGIDAVDLPQLFRMFSQLGDGGSPSAGGLGIGLALTRGIVELHGGTITADSAGRNLGSDFRIDLPGVVVQGPGETVSQPDSEAAATPRPLRILVADDNVDAAESLAALLESWGHVATVATNGAAAVEAVRTQPPDFAFLDIGMPILDGYGAATQIRALELACSIRLVALTGWGQSDDVDRAFATGFDAHVTKPVDPERLRRLLAGDPHARR